MRPMYLCRCTISTERQQRLLPSFDHAPAILHHHDAWQAKDGGRRAGCGSHAYAREGSCGGLLLEPALLLRSPRRLIRFYESATRCCAKQHKQYYCHAAVCGRQCYAGEVVLSG